MTAVNIDRYRTYLGERNGEADLLNRRLDRREEFFAEIEAIRSAQSGRLTPRCSSVACGRNDRRRTSHQSPPSPASRRFFQVRVDLVLPLASTTTTQRAAMGPPKAPVSRTATDADQRASASPDRRRKGIGMR
jgi:hypothetical protein